MCMLVDSNRWSIVRGDTKAKRLIISLSVYIPRCPVPLIPNKMVKTLGTPSKDTSIRPSERVQDTVNVGKGQKLVRLIPDLIRKGLTLLRIQELGVTEKTG